jgi:nucleoside-diphosphate-sugar epimerase
MMRQQCTHLNSRMTTMRVFVTGATGFIGSAVVKELLAAGHSVLGLARSDASAAALAAAGAEVHRGSLTDLDSLRRGAATADGVIHTAFIHDFVDFKNSCETDRHAIETLGDALAGTSRPLVVAAGIGLLAVGRLATEEDLVRLNAATMPRVATEEAVNALLERGVNASVVRLPPTVHGEGDHGFVAMLIGKAREKGVAGYIGEGNNRWPAVHRFDAARLFRLALEKDIPGARHHGVAEEGIPFREIATAIGRRLEIPVVSVPEEKATEHFDWFARFTMLDCPASSKLTRERLGWEPTGPGLFADLDAAAYFRH